MFYFLEFVAIHVNIYTHVCIYLFFFLLLVYFILDVKIEENQSVRVTDDYGSICRMLTALVLNCDFGFVWFFSLDFVGGISVRALFVFISEYATVKLKLNSGVRDILVIQHFLLAGA